MLTGGVCVANLIANYALDDLLPVQVTGCELLAVKPVAITSITPARGQHGSVSAALKKSHGLAFPAPNRAIGTDGERCVWVGPGQGLLLGRAPTALTGAAITDQSDGWAVMRLQGPGAEAVLARLVPVDLRMTEFKRGHAAKTLLNHMPLSVFRSARQAFDLMVFRSMVATAVHEIQAAMESIAAQQN